MCFSTDHPRSFPTMFMLTGSKSVSQTWLPTWTPHFPILVPPEHRLSWLLQTALSLCAPTWACHPSPHLASLLVPSVLVNGNTNAQLVTPETRNYLQFFLFPHFQHSRSGQTYWFLSQIQILVSTFISTTLFRNSYSYSGLWFFSHLLSFSCL